MFGKVNPAPAVSKSIRMVFWSFLESIKPFKTIKNDSKIQTFKYAILKNAFNKLSS